MNSIIYNPILTSRTRFLNSITPFRSVLMSWNLLEQNSVTPCAGFWCLDWNSYFTKMVFSLKHSSWNILAEIFLMKYSHWNDPHEVFSLKYSSWNIPTEMILMKYSRWNVPREIFSLKWSSWNIPAEMILMKYSCWKQKSSMSAISLGIKIKMSRSQVPPHPLTTLLKPIKFFLYV